MTEIETVPPAERTRGEGIAARVLRIAAVPEGEQLALVDLADAARRVETLSEVKDADVTRAWPDGVLITVTERTAVAVVELGGRRSRWRRPRTR